MQSRYTPYNTSVFCAKITSCTCARSIATKVLNFKGTGGVSLFTGLDYWTGLLDWNTGLDYWTGILDWTTGLEYWTGILDWTTKMSDLRCSTL